MTAPTPARSSLDRSLALALSLSLALPTGLCVCPPTAQAAWAPAPEPAEDPAVDEARKLYDEGKARFDTFDYEGAVQLWTQAYAKLPEDAAGIRNSMVYNIATAQEKAFELDSDVQHLRQAQMLLESYIDNFKALYPRNPETKAEVDKAEDRIASLKERIADAEKGDTRPPPPVAGEIGWTSDVA
ncbi:MAG: hypothetical protein KDK70_16120, partial [Myxococcales bacterium]|nr:hypothetical protein [Myxococcales bacterium]